MAAIIHNSGINYSLYYNVLNYFKTIMTNHPSIAMVSQGALSDFDYDEFPNYPAVNFSTSISLYFSNISLSFLPLKTTFSICILFCLSSNCLVPKFAELL